MLQASDKIIALTINFGSDNWLSELIALCNVRRQQIAIYRNRVRFLKRIIFYPQVIPEALVLLSQAKELTRECQTLKQLATELYSKNE